jgi:hypothetical protein
MTGHQLHFGGDAALLCYTGEGLAQYTGEGLAQHHGGVSRPSRMVLVLGMLFLKDTFKLVTHYRSG